MQKIWYWLLPLTWMGVIFYASAQPYEKQDMKPFLTNMVDLSFLAPYLDWVSLSYHQSEVSVDVLGVAGFIEFFIRKGAHVTVFFVLMLLFLAAVRKTTSCTFPVSISLSFTLTVAYAGLDEFHQGFTAGRTPYAGDVVLDSFGAFMALLLLIYVHLLKRKKRS
ncbi:VanZ family protein [Virgibacillus dakarensis]|nr:MULTISPECIES: VanZ family protein [Bacillaceae]MBT2216081.1 VanZ family protein [Virgibacillus dakarensis]MTW87648.1 VanZ family protein [Virgibacillus dakarensis]